MASAPTPDPAASIVAGDGEMADLMRATDWAATPLGPVAGWPAALRTSVGICLASRFPILIWWGPDLRLLYNDAYRPVLGRSKHPALGRAGREVWGEIWHIIGPMLDGVMSGAPATWSEDLLLPMDRYGYLEETYWTYSYSPIRDGDRVGGVFTAVMETTDRVLAERRLAALRTLGGVAGTARGVEEACRLAVAALAGHPDVPHAAVHLPDPHGAHRTVASVSAPGVDLSATDWPVAEVASSGTGRRVPLPFQPPHAGAPWPTGPREGMAIPLRTPAGGACAGVLTVAAGPGRALDDAYAAFFHLLAEQVTALITAASALEEARARADALAALDRAKTEFFSNVSHEFRTPLTLMLGPLESLEAMSADRPDALREIEVIRRNGGRMLRLVNSLLDFSRAEAHRLQMTYRPTDLGSFTAEVASGFRSAVEEAGLWLRVEADPIGEPVWVDAEAWEKIVLNLVSNAFKFTFRGGITVRVRRDGADAVLEVEDTGTGIPPDQVDRVFERFHRIPGAVGRSHEGSGIGLALVQELARLHGGGATVESAPERGTTMRVSVPLGTAHLDPERVGADGRPAPEGHGEQYVAEARRWTAAPGAAVTESAPAGARRGRVLVVDDNADMRDHLTRILAPHYEVTTAGDGRQALRAALGAPPDLVLSDVMMPVMDGLALLRRLRADQRTARIPVLFLSARAGEEAAVTALAEGADDYLVKPFSAQELLARVTAHLELGRGRRAGEERFLAMAEANPACVWVSDREGRCTYLNRAWIEYTGRPLEDQLGDGWAANVHPDDLAPLRREWEDALRRRAPLDVEYRLRRHDGVHRWNVVRGLPFADGEGDDFAGYAGTVVDIHDRHLERERNALMADVGLTLDVELGVRERLTRLVGRLVETRVARSCTVALLDGDPQTGTVPPVGSRAAAGPAPPPVDAAAVRRSASEGPLLLPGPDGGEPVAVVPLRARGRMLGVLALRGPDGAAAEDGHLEFLVRIAERAGLALDNALLHARERRAHADAEAARRRLSDLHALSATLSRTLTTGGIARVGAETARATLRASGALVLVDDDARGRPEVLHASGALADVAAPGGRDDDVLSLVSRRRAPMYLDRGLTGDGGPVALVPLGPPHGGVGGVLALALPTADGAVSVADRAHLEAVGQLIGQAMARARRYEAQRDLAEVLQNSLLPRTLPRTPGMSIAAHYSPGAGGAEVGGDWFDALALPCGRVALIVGDVVGRGPGAAAVMGSLRSALNAYLSEGHGPAAALSRLSAYSTQVEGADASTAVCMVVDPGGPVVWARAGHPPPLVVEDGRVRRLPEVPGPLLGIGRGDDYRDHHFTLPPGATLVAFSDGLFERRGETIDDGLARLEGTAAGCPGFPVAAFVDALVHRSAATGPVTDDVVAIGLRRHGAPMQETWPALPGNLTAARRAARAWLRALPLTHEQADDVVLAVGEAAANSVEHGFSGGGSGTLTVGLAEDGDGDLLVTVGDSGAWRAPEPDRAADRGRGLDVMRAVMSSVDVVAGPAGTEVRMRHRPEAARPEDPPGRPDGPDPAGVAFAVEERVGDHDAVVAVRGELDRPRAPEVREAVLRGLRAMRDVLVDLSEVTFLGSAGLAVLAEARRAAEAEGAGLRVVVRAGSSAERVLRLTGMADGVDVRGALTG